jgi:hypothetical protein
MSKPPSPDPRYAPPESRFTHAFFRAVYECRHGVPRLTAADQLTPGTSHETSALADQGSKADSVFRAGYLAAVRWYDQAPGGMHDERDPFPPAWSAWHAFAAVGIIEVIRRPEIVTQAGFFV